MSSSHDASAALPSLNVDADASANAAAAAPDSHINHASAREYWQSIDADVNGMLGGFPYVSRADLQGSKNFLARLGIANKLAAAGTTTTGSSITTTSGAGQGHGDGKIARAVDCGAGIGRITSGLLLNLATTVDVVEPIAKFTDALKGQSGIGEVYNVGLEGWIPSPATRYNLIWNQWCLGHLTDVQLIEYLIRCAGALADGGLIVVKENMSTSGTDVFDEVDSSVTRTDEKFREIFTKAHLKLKRTELQKGFPKELYPVRMYALVPDR